MHLHYTDRHRLPKDKEKELNLTFHETVEDMVKVCDVVTINCPLHPETEHMFDDKLIGKMKRGAYLVNTARGKICDRDAVARALKSGQLAGLSIPPRTLQRAALFLDRVEADEGAAYGYQNADVERTPTAIGLLCRMYSG